MLSKYIRTATTYPKQRQQILYRNTLITAEKTKSERDNTKWKEM